MFEFMANEDQFFDAMLPSMQFFMAIMVFFLILVIWYFSNDTASQRITARIFLKYRQFRIGMLLSASGAAVELIAYTLAILVGTLTNIYVIVTFIVSTVIYVLGISIITYVSLYKGRNWTKKLSKTEEGGAQ